MQHTKLVIQLGNESHLFGACRFGLRPNLNAVNVKLPSAIRHPFAQERPFYAPHVLPPTLSRYTLGMSESASESRGSPRAHTFPLTIPTLPQHPRKRHPKPRASVPTQSAAHWSFTVIRFSHAEANGLSSPGSTPPPAPPAPPASPAPPESAPAAPCSESRAHPAEGARCSVHRTSTCVPM